ncbi:hypothetical protein DRP04_12395 [Archaeoglobales archaeon]|nr:MAG: hypothetical protein DRP04_12395 [Archaeoglobales archaeon]
MAWNLVQESKKPHVCICVPHWGNVSLEWVETTYGPLRFIPQPDFKKSTRLARGILNLDTERNMLVELALEDPTVTHILFLDTDNIIESPKDPNQALRMLLSCNAPIASGLYRAKKPKGEYPYAMWVKNPHGEGYLPIAKWTGNWIKVDVIGFGFVLIKREVFEKVPKPWFQWKERAPSEDFFFCEKVAKYGYEVRVLTDVKLSHVGTLKVKSTGEITTLDV